MENQPNRQTIEFVNQVATRLRKIDFKDIDMNVAIQNAKTIFSSPEKTDEYLQFLRGVMDKMENDIKEIKDKKNNTE